MKNAKKLLSLLLVTILMFLITPLIVAARDTSVEESKAAALKSLGLFRGVSETDFDLNRAPTRIEALVMLIRTLGKENEALNGYWWHPFTDVPEWANAYVGYAYLNGLTNGVSATEFGSGEASAAMYLTFVLRALDYSDTAGDFTWNDPYSLARQAGILPEGVDINNFWRADVATISYSALHAHLKGSAVNLATRLINQQVFDWDQLSAAENLAASSETRSTWEPAPVETSIYTIQPTQPTYTEPVVQNTEPAWTPEPVQTIVPLVPSEPEYQQPVVRGTDPAQYLGEWYVGVPDFDESGRVIFIVNMETGKIHEQNCRYNSYSKYDYPRMITSHPDELIACDSFYSYCQVCN